MHPILLRIGPVTLYTYGMMVAIGFISGILLGIHLAKKSNLPHEKISDIAFWMALAAIVGSRIMFVAGEPSYFLKNPLKVFALWEGGLVFYGGFIAAALVLIFSFRRHRIPLWRTLDVAGPALPLGHAFGRLGCVFAGCCYGCPTAGPLGIVFSDPKALARPLNVPLLPTQLIEAAIEFLLFAALLWFYPRKRFHGQVILLWVFGYAVSRFVIEFYRADPRDFLIPETLSISQGISILLFAAGIVLWPILRRREAVKRG